MVIGLKNQLKSDEMTMTDGSLLNAGHDKDTAEDWTQYYDDMSGLPLRSDQFAKGRAEEMEVPDSFPIYHKVPIAETHDYTGKGPVGTKWVDISKGDQDDPEYISRRVAMEIKRKHDEDIFAATPPLDAKKLLFSLAVTGTHKTTKQLKLIFVDVKKA